MRPVGEMIMRCHGCGTEIQVEGRVARSDECPSCARPLHCCRNCRFHDPTAHNQCREPQAEWVADRESANFCDYFEPSAGGGAGIAEDRSTEARRKLDDLFK